MNQIDIAELRAWMQECGAIALRSFRNVVGHRKAEPVHAGVHMQGRWPAAPRSPGGEFGRMGELFTADVVYDLSAFGRGELHGYEAITEASLALSDATRSVITSLTSA